MIYNVALNDHKKVSNSCKIYIILLIITYITPIGIGCVYIDFFGMQ